MKLIYLLPVIALLSLCCQSTPPKEPSILLDQLTKMMSVLESTNQAALKLQEELKRNLEQMASEHKKVSARQDMEIKALKEAIDSSHKEYIESCKMSDALDKELKKQMEINKKLEQEWRALNQQDSKNKKLAEELEKSRKELERSKEAQEKTK
jgi:hypothetical protein